MTSNRVRIGITAALIAIAGACSSNDSTSSSGTGGKGAGGKSATGGSANTGGQGGTGGSVASGGSVSAGGSQAGGSQGSGGAGAGGNAGASAGGSLGSGGAAGAAGAGGGGNAGGSAGGSLGSGGTAGAAGAGGGVNAGGSAGGSTGAGGSAAGGSTEILDGAPDVASSDGGGSDMIDAPDDASLPGLDGASLDGGQWSSWSAFFPLAAGSGAPGESGESADVSGHGFFVSYGPVISFSNSAMVMSGSGDVSVPPSATGPVLDLTGSYSVSVWVTMTDTSDWRTFVSADGNTVSAFYLQKRSDTGQFGFTLSTSDSNDGVSAPCVTSSTVTPQANTPYHLVATRDGATGLDTLYVNGVADGSKTCLSSDGVGWAATTFGIGHGMYNGANTDYFAGSVSGVGLINRVLSASEVAALYALGRD
jgi:hypothetical protein